MKALLPIFLIVTVDILGLTIVLPLLPFYAEHYGASPTVVGWLVTAFALCQLISGPILGSLSDRTGRKPMLIVSQIGTLIGFLILAFANSLFWVFLARIIDGFTAGNLSVAQAYIADNTEPKDRAKSFAVIGIAFGLGFLIGPAISGYLSQFGYSTPIFAAAGLSALSVLATTFLLPSKEKSATASDAELPAGRRLGLLNWAIYRDYFRNPSLAPLLFQFLCFCLSFSIFISGFALFAERRFTIGGKPWGPKEVGYAYAYAGLLGILIQGGAIRRLVPRFGERALAISGFLAFGIGYAILGFAYTLPLFILSTTIASYGSSVIRPTLTSLVTQAADRRDQGVVLGLTQSLNSISQITAPLLAGPLIQHGHLTIWALCASFMGLFGATLGFRFFF